MLIDPHTKWALTGIGVQFTLTVLSHLRTAQSDFSSYLSRVGTDANRQAISVYLGGICTACQCVDAVADERIWR